MTDQSHIVAAEMSVHDFNYCEDVDYDPVLSTSEGGYSDSHGQDDSVVQHSYAQWIEGSSFSGSSSLKLRVSNKQIIGSVMIIGCLSEISALTMMVC